MAKKSKNKLSKEVEVSKDVQIIQLKNQLVRALADYDNLRKRIENERSTFEKIIGFKIVARILPIFDMLEEAQKHLQDSGIALVLEEFKKYSYFL